MTGRLAAAEAYLRAGWTVVPLHGIVAGRCTCGREDCPSPGKHPRVRWRPYQNEPSTLEEVRSWWRRWPEANVGIVTGTVSGVAVVDVDPRNDGDRALDELEAGYGPLPDTAISLTGGGGEHLWFRLDEPVPSALLADGVELKAEGGLVVAPPSRHVSGGIYRWLAGADPSRRPLAPLPAWIASVAAGSFRRGAGTPPPPRSDAEREAFAAAWARAGITLLPGDNYYRCPFHDDEHPSLHVDAEGCRWYCFACRIGGGIGALRRRLGEPDVGPRRPRRGWVGPHRAVTLSGDLELQVVGESAHQDELLELTGGRRHPGGVEMDAVAELVPDEERRSRIEVWIGDRLVGRLRYEDAARLRHLVDAAVERYGVATCRAQIRGGWDRGDGDVGRFGVVVFCGPGRVAYDGGRKGGGDGT
ncbi:MAG TPA: hypothetical protein ENK55_12900 [Actinobacteria bacterium]|nr:hypothetical protein [Actinomycetota bacterium]